MALSDRWCLFSEIGNIEEGGERIGLGREMMYVFSFE